MGVLDGRVVIVTGAGRGIGRECALLAAREGAKVLVNDLGGALFGGDEGDEAPAQTVAKEIVAAGGEAVANTDSVTSLRACQGMVEQAKDSFGALHAIISPAGILARCLMFHKMSEEDWDTPSSRVHLKGKLQRLPRGHRGCFASNRTKLLCIVHLDQRPDRQLRASRTTGAARQTGDHGAVADHRHGEPCQERPDPTSSPPPPGRVMIASIPIKDEAAPPPASSG